MTTPLLLTRCLPVPVPATRPLPLGLPDHHYDPLVGANVVADGRLLVEAADPATVANYTSTQDQGGVRRKDDPK